MFKIKRYLISNDNLKPWVKFIWHFEGYGVHIKNKLLPMDNIDIIINLGDEIIYETAINSINAPDIHVNGLRNQHSFINQKGNIDVWGISFYSFGLYPFINKSLADVRNEIMDLNLLSVALSRKLKVAMSHDGRKRKVDSVIEALDSELKTNKKILEKSQIINEFIRDFDISVSEFCLNYEVNQKTFERFVYEMTGFLPVNLRRIKRYMLASNELIVNKPAKISKISYDYNYTDQAYFTKEVNKFSGVTPRKFREEKNTVVENSIYI